MGRRATGSRIGVASFWFGAATLLCLGNRDATHRILETARAKAAEISADANA